MFKGVLPWLRYFQRRGESGINSWNLVVSLWPTTCKLVKVWIFNQVEFFCAILSTNWRSLYVFKIIFFYRTKIFFFKKRTENIWISDIQQNYSKLLNFHNKSADFFWIVYVSLFITDQTISVSHDQTWITWRTRVTTLLNMLSYDSLNIENIYKRKRFSDVELKIFKLISIS